MQKKCKKDKGISNSLLNLKSVLRRSLAGPEGPSQLQTLNSIRRICYVIRWQMWYNRIGVKKTLFS